MINKKISGDEVELFFVDFGDVAILSWNEVALIPNKFITKLPFQVQYFSLEPTRLLIK